MKKENPEIFTSILPQETMKIMKTKDKDSVLTYINERIIENQQEMAAANAAGDNKTYIRQDSNKKAELG